MYVPELHLTASNTPILNKAEIDDIGEHLVADFCPEAMRVPMTIDIDSFVETYLGFTQDYQYLSHNGIYLGMTVFCDTNKVPVYDPAHERAEYISAKAGTIIIDNRLLAENQEHRYRFTEGHEASHGILHGSFFEQKQTGTYADNHVPMVQCRSDLQRYPKSNKNWNNSDWMEWQANRLSSAILMPKSMVIAAAKAAERKTQGCNANAALIAVSTIFNVSNEAARYRLQECGFVA